MKNLKAIALILALFSMNDSIGQGILQEVNKHFEYAHFFYFEADTIYRVKPDRGWVNFNMPKFTFEKTNENKFYQLGVDLGYTSRHVILGFKVDNSRLFRYINNSDTIYIIPFLYIDASSFSDDSKVDVYTSQKFRKRWKWFKNSLKKSKKATYHQDLDSYYEFGGFHAVERVWKYGEVILPKNYNLNKDIWIFFVLQDPRERMMLYFPNKLKEE